MKLRHSTAIITMLLAAFVVSCKKNVNEPVQAESEWFVSIEPRSVELLEGESVRLNATVSCDGENVSDATVTWEVDDASVATISDDGLLRARAKGSTKVRAIYSEEVFDETTVIVKAIIDPTSASFDMDTLEGMVGDKIPLAPHVVLEPAEATVRNFVWASSDNDVVTVDEDGVATCIAKGKTYVNVGIYSRNDELITNAQIPITVNERYVLSEFSGIEDESEFLSSGLSEYRLNQAKIAARIECLNNRYYYTMYNSSIIKDEHKTYLGVVDLSDAEQPVLVDDVDMNHFEVVSNSNPSAASVSVETLFGHVFFAIWDYGYPDQQTTVRVRYTNNSQSVTTFDREIKIYSGISFFCYTVVEGVETHIDRFYDEKGTVYHIRPTVKVNGITEQPWLLTGLTYELTHKNNSRQVCSVGGVYYDERGPYLLVRRLIGNPDRGESISPYSSYISVSYDDGDHIRGSERFVFLGNEDGI